MTQIFFVKQAQDLLLQHSVHVGRHTKKLNRVSTYVVNGGGKCVSLTADDITAIAQVQFVGRLRPLRLFPEIS